MTYLIVGPDGEKKEAAIKQIKNKYLPQKKLLSFDYEVLFGHKLDSQDLQKALLAMPVFGDWRLVVVRECHKLNERNKTLLSDFVSSGMAQVVLILEAEPLTQDDPFLKCLKSSAQIIQIEQEREANVFDVTRALSRNKKAEALKILSGLFDAGVHPLQIMGGLVWFWGECKESLSRKDFEEGLRMLQETDLNIKRSRTNPQHAVEILLVKLGGLMN